MKPTITVITPTRNRSRTLKRVFNSLQKQTYKKFEWIVCDDSSNDNSLTLLKNFKKKANFKIRIYHFKERAGKPKIDNFCVKKAKGNFIVFADSDDAFKKNSFFDLIEEWHRIPSHIKKKIFAIITRVQTPCGKPLEEKLNINSQSVSLTNLWHKYDKKKEKWLFIKKSILLKYTFLEIDYYVPEGILWEKISLKYNVWILDKCYRIFYNDTHNSITHSKKIKYPIGQLESLKMQIRKYNKKKLSIKKIKHFINYYRYFFINNLFLNNKSKDKIFLSYSIKLIYKSFGFILFCKDFLSQNIHNEKFKKNLSHPSEIQ